MHILTTSSASDCVFTAAADLFSLLAAPTRLRIVCELCRGERKVAELLQRLGPGPANVSRHLGALYRGGVVGRRRAGSQVFYSLSGERVSLLCDAVCKQSAGLTAPARAR